MADVVSLLSRQVPSRASPRQRFCRSNINSMANQRRPCERRSCEHQQCRGHCCKTFQEKWCVFFHFSCLLFSNVCKSKDVERKQLLTAHLKAGCYLADSTAENLCLLPLPPHSNIIKSQLIPPSIQHGLLASCDSLPRHIDRRWHEGIQPVEHAPAIRNARATQQMPKRQRIILTSVRQHNPKLNAPLLITQLRKIKFPKRRLKLRRRILEIRRARPDSRPRLPNSARRNKRLAPIQPEAHPSHPRAQNSRACIIHLQRVRASQIHG